MLLWGGGGERKRVKTDTSMQVRSGQVRSGQERKEGNVLFNDALNTF